jgi:DNA-binding NarL/FixJ family response regulator
MAVMVAVWAAAAIARTGLSNILEQPPLIQVAGAVADAASLRDFLTLQVVDVLVMDAPAEDPTEFSGFSWVLLTEEVEVNDLVAPGAIAPETGRAILPRSAGAGEITAAVLGAAAGLIVADPSLWLAPAKASQSHLQALSSREIQVLGMLASGLGNKAIAKQLHISEHTVKFHISSIFQKLQVSSRTEAVALGAKLGLILL